MDREITAPATRPSAFALIGQAASQALGLVRGHGLWVLAGWAGLSGISWLGWRGVWSPDLLWLGTVIVLGVLLAREAGGALGVPVLRVTAASILIAIVLAFFLLLSVMVGGFIAFAVMAGSGFDFDAAGDGPEAFRAAFDGFLQTPGGQVSQAVFWIAMAVWLVSAGRALPYAAATVGERRIVVLEAFNRSRGRGLAYTAVLIAALLPAVVVFAIAPGIGVGGVRALIDGAGGSLGAIGVAAASLAVSPQAVDLPSNPENRGNSD